MWLKGATPTIYIYTYNLRATPPSLSPGPPAGGPPVPGAFLQADPSGPPLQAAPWPTNPLGVQSLFLAGLSARGPHTARAPQWAAPPPPSLCLSPSLRTLVRISAALPWVWVDFSALPAPVSQISRGLGPLHARSSRAAGCGSAPRSGSRTGE